METWMTNFHGLLTLDNKLLQTDVSCVSTHMVCLTLLSYKVIISIYLSVCYDTSIGWGGSRSSGTAEVSDLWQCCSIRSKVWWRISAISAPLCHCYLEPFSFYWPGSQIWPGESTDLPNCVSLSLKFSFPVLTIHLVFVAACKQCHPVLGFGLWKATL